MAQAWKHRDNGDGTATEWYFDGSTQTWVIDTGTLVSQTGPDPEIADLIQRGASAQTSAEVRAIDDTIARKTERDAKSWEEENRRWDYDAGLRGRQVSNLETGTANQLELGRGQLDLAGDRLGFDYWNARQGREIDRNRLALESWRLEQQFGLDAARVGQDYYKTLLQFRQQPRDWLQASNWAQNADVLGPPASLKALEAGTALMPGFTSRAGVPDLGATSAKLDVNDPRVAALKAILKTAPPTDQQGLAARDQQTLDLIQSMYKAGAPKVANQWGVLDPEDQEIFKGGVAWLGGSPERWTREIDATKYRSGDPLAA